MQDNYRRNYLQIYIWKTLAIVVSFASFFVVVPFLTSNQQLYGIYTFCMSFQLYLSYADIGFLSAGQKYAAEAYARGDQKEERNIFGFVGAVLISMILPFSLFMIVLAIKPELALNGVAEKNRSLVSVLFLIIAIISPIQVFLQRVTQSILTIRVKDYIASRIDLAGNILKILSVFVFFTGGRYMLVPYFIFINCVTIACSLIIIYLIRRNENYDILDLLKSVKFSGKYFNLMKKLSFASLGLTLSWVICYELDLIYIGKIYSVDEVALYAVCLTLINFMRQFFNIIYGPYSQRFNHFIALNQKEKFSQLLGNIIKYTFPFCIFVCAVLCFSSKYFILFWVGTDYTASIPILAVLAWFYIFHFFSQPGGYICISTEKYKLINLQSIINPIVFIGSFFVLHAIGVGIISFAISKMLMIISSTVIVGIAVKRWTNTLQDIKPFLPLIIVLGLFALFTNWLFPIVFPNPEKSTIRLMQLFIIIAMMGIVYCGCIILLDSKLKSIVKYQLLKWKK